MKKAAIFDMDGTLVANSPIHIRAFEIFCARYGVTDWREKLANGFGMGNDDIMRLVMPEEVIREKGLAALADEKEAIYREDIDTIVGICYVKDFLPYVNQPVPDFIHLKDMVRPAYFIRETKKCSQLFKELKERRLQIAIIVDEYGGTAGLVTLEDLMESIFGNIQDEYDNEQEEIFRVSENEFTVDGTTSIDEISDLTDTELPEGDYDTIAGLVTDLLGRIPKENEHPSVQVCGLTITVLEIEDQRLSRLLIVKNDPRKTPEEETHED